MDVFQYAVLCYANHLHSRHVSLRLVTGLQLSYYFRSRIGYGDFSPAELPIGGQIFFPFFSYFALGISWVALQVVPDFINSFTRGFCIRVLKQRTCVEFC